MGDPIELQLRGYTLSIRKDDAADIEVTALEKAQTTAVHGEEQV